MERFAGSSEVRRFLAQQDDAIGRQNAASGGGVPAQRTGGEPARVSEQDVHRARLAVARGSQDAEDCKLLLDMLGLTPGDQGIAPVRE
ncbi:hypothetical protein [Sciscionella marina]|uniref:hypothetical protein n=1 Tax=Sciscionella marina TaxID=508770 RepID=UPI00038068D9|nr:hypothetical protein [Sciscionella marina]